MREKLQSGVKVHWAELQTRVTTKSPPQFAWIPKGVVTIFPINRNLSCSFQSFPLFWKCLTSPGVLFFWRESAVFAPVSFDSSCGIGGVSQFVSNRLVGSVSLPIYNPNILQGYPVNGGKWVLTAWMGGFSFCGHSWDSCWVHTYRAFD